MREVSMEKRWSTSPINSSSHRRQPKESSGIVHCHIQIPSGRRLQKKTNILANNDYPECSRNNNLIYRKVRQWNLLTTERAIEAEDNAA
ncbi:hypothetical protein PV325_012353, partial [Microctonus aethiopoides]